MADMMETMAKNAAKFYATADPETIALSEKMFRDMRAAKGEDAKSTDSFLSMLAGLGASLLGSGMAAAPEDSGYNHALVSATRKVEREGP